MNPNDPKIPPQNIEAEASLIGSILLDQEALIKVADVVHADDFYEKKHQHIFEAILMLYEGRSAIDVLTLSNKLDEIKKLQSIGGSAYLTELVNNVPSAAHVTEYAKIVSQKSTLRRLIHASAEISALGFDEHKDMQHMLDKAEQLIFEVSHKHLKQNFVHIESILNRSFDRLDELHKDSSKLRGIPTGFKALDNVLAGFQRSDLIILAARPAMGKTSLALNIAHHAAVKEGVPVGIFSLEMSQDQLVDRLLTAESGIDGWNLRTGNLSDKDFEALGTAMGALSEAPIYIDDAPGINVMEMRTKARRAQSEHGLGLLLVDYLQLMSGSNTENRVQEISEISRGLKGLARELDIPIIALSQLSRSVESRSPQIPQLSDLRESGSIEQDADVVLMMYREDYYNPETEREGITDLFIKKHRNGPTGDIELYFHAEKVQFRTIDNQHTN